MAQATDRQKHGNSDRRPLPDCRGSAVFGPCGPSRQPPIAGWVQSCPAGARRPGEGDHAHARRLHPRRRAVAGGRGQALRPDTAAAETRLLAAPVTFTTAAGPRDLACASTGWLMPSRCQQVNCRSSSGFSSWLTASGHDSFCRDAAEKRAIGWRPAPGCVAVLAVADHIGRRRAGPGRPEPPLVAVSCGGAHTGGKPMIRRGLAIRKAFSFMVSTAGWWLLPLGRCGRAQNPRPSGRGSVP